MKDAYALRARLWKQNPCCHWCGRSTILLPRVQNAADTLPPQFRDLVATLDHLRAKHHPGRLDRTPGEHRIVLACYECNNKRDLPDMKSHWTEEQRRETGKAGERNRLARLMVAVSWLWNDKGPALTLRRSSSQDTP